MLKWMYATASKVIWQGEYIAGTSNVAINTALPTNKENNA